MMKDVVMMYLYGSAIFLTIATEMVLRMLYKHCKAMPKRCRDCKFYKKAKHTMRIDYYYACSIKNAVGPCAETKEYYIRKCWIKWRPK